MKVNEEDRLTRVRDEIRRVTEDILHLAARRSRLSEEMGLIKRAKGIPMQDLLVERELRRRVRDRCSDLGLDPKFGLRLLNLLLGESLKIQRSVKAKGDSTFTSILKKAGELEASGEEVIHLEVGEPDFPPPRRVVDAVGEALAGGLTHYTDPVGIAPLREALAERLNRRFHLDLKEDQIVVTHGGRFALNLAIAAHMKLGGEALIFEPAYPAYRRLVELYGGNVVAVPTRLHGGWTPDLEQVESLISESTDLMILNYPSNPTGRILDEELFEGLVELARRKGILVVSDEVYLDYAFRPHRSILEYPECSSIFISSFSKSYSMTGFRIGYAVSQRDTVERMADLEGLTLTCIPEFIQHSARAALQCEEELAENAKRIKRRIDLAAERLKNLPLSFRKPDGGFYIFARVDRPGFDGDEYTLGLLERYKVAVTPGGVFGDYPDHFRISLCQPEEAIAEASRRIGESLS